MTVSTSELRAESAAKNSARAWQTEIDPWRHRRVGTHQQATAGPSLAANTAPISGPTAHQTAQLAATLAGNPRVVAQAKLQERFDRSPRVVAQSHRVAALNHRDQTNTAAPTTSSSAPVQAFFNPLSYAAWLLGLGDEQGKKPEQRPFKARGRIDYGDTHKPLKTKDADEIGSLTFLEGSGSTSDELQKGESSEPPEKVDTTEKPPYKLGTKLNWGDFSTTGVKSEKARNKIGGKEEGYSVSFLRGTYERAPLAGYGIDRSYSVGPRENLATQVLHAKGQMETELSPNTLKAIGKGDLQLGALESGLEAGGKLDFENDAWSQPRLHARAAGKLGGYVAKGSVGGELGFRIPYTNIMVSGGLTGTAAYGLGVSGEAGFKASADRGLRATLAGKLVSGLGFGGAAMMNIGKYDPVKGWMEEPDEAYLDRLPPPGTANRWQNVPAEKLSRLKKLDRKRRRR